MATSPLGAALIGGGNEAAALGMDPTMLQVQPDLQLAQALMKSGIDTSAAHPMQALARIFQAGTGQLVQHQAISDLAKAYSQSATNAAGTLPEGHPLKAALMSPDPTVRMQALQVYPKVMTLLGEPQKVTPGEDVFPGSYGVRPGVQGTGPQSAPGKIAADVQRAQGTNPAAVTPLARALGKETVTPEGVPYPAEGVMQPRPVPTTTIKPPPSRVPLSSLQPAVAPAAAGGMPEAVARAAGLKASAVAQAENPALIARAGGTEEAKNPALIARAGGVAAAENPALIARAGGVEQAKNPPLIARAGGEAGAKAGVEYGDLLNPPAVGKGPGQTEPLQTPRGTKLPPVSDQAPLPKSPKELDTKLPVWQKTQTDWNGGLQAGQQAEQRLNTIANVFKAFETGSFSTDKAKISAALKAVGINIPDRLLANPEAVQLALHENYVETIQQLKAATPRFTQMEFKALSANKEHPDIQPGANLQMLAEDIGTLRQARDLPTDFTTAQRHGWRDPQSFEQSWLRHNPLSGYVDQVKKEIGPLKGMEGNAAANPVRVKTLADVQKLDPGTRFVIPEGQFAGEIGTVPRK